MYLGNIKTETQKMRMLGQRKILKCFNEMLNFE